MYQTRVYYVIFFGQTLINLRRIGVRMKEELAMCLEKELFLISIKLMMLILFAEDIR